MLYLSCWLLTWSHHSILAQPVPVVKLPPAMPAKLVCVQIDYSFTQRNSWRTSCEYHPLKTEWLLSGNAVFSSPHIMLVGIQLNGSCEVTVMQQWYPNWKWLCSTNMLRRVEDMFGMIYMIHNCTVSQSSFTNQNWFHSGRFVLWLVTLVLQHLPVVLQHVAMLLPNCNTYVLYSVEILCATFHLVYAL